MKKFIILVLSIFLAGCSVKYNIEFKDDKVYENFNVEVNSNEEYSINYLTKNDFYVSINPEMIKYKKSISKTNDLTKFNYSYEYDINDYKNSMALSSCFKGHNVIKEDNYYLFSTSKGVKCMTSDSSTLIENLDIVITTNHKLIETNADEISDYTYIWHVNKDNYKEKNIFLKVYQNRYILNYKNNFVNILLIISGIVGLIIFITLFIVIKKKKTNSI